MNYLDYAQRRMLPNHIAWEIHDLAKVMNNTAHPTLEQLDAAADERIKMLHRMMQPFGGAETVRYTVEIRNDAGDKIYQEDVHVPKYALEDPPNQDGEVWSETDVVLYNAAPEMCPWDCDTCREE